MEMAQDTTVGIRAYTDFRIYRTTDRLSMYQMALALGYSTRINFRRLESGTHGFWPLVGEDLLHDLSTSPQTLVISQYTVTVPRGFKPLSADTSLASKKTKFYRERKPDIIGVWIGRRERRPEVVPIVPIQDFSRLRQTEKPASRLSTDAQAKRDWCTRVPQGFDLNLNGNGDVAQVPNWHTSQIVGYATLFHIELKKPVSRRYNKPESFFESLSAHISEATICANRQASVIFESEAQTNRIITILASGEWWTFKITVRGGVEHKLFTNITEGGQDYSFLNQTFCGTTGNLTDYRVNVSKLLPARSTILNVFQDDMNNVSHKHQHNQRLPNPSNPFMDSDSEEDEVERMVAVSDSELTGNESGVEGNPGATPIRSPPPPKILVYRYLRHCDPKLEEPIVLCLRDALPKANAMSRLMMFGSPASNQRLYLIQELLRREVAMLERAHPNII
ncbi:hypothetical protein BJ165DRAFT_1410876 [Panaeolus papilionaceus]|nr:hypothetical protein BJ165DRAFT_1410876 [Panaeolus papilionaceus]